MIESGTFLNEIKKMEHPYKEEEMNSLDKELLNAIKNTQQIVNVTHVTSGAKYDDLCYNVVLEDGLKFDLYFIKTMYSNKYSVVLTFPEGDEIRLVNVDQYDGKEISDLYWILSNNFLHQKNEIVKARIIKSMKGGINVVG